MSITDELRSFTTDPLLCIASVDQHIERLTAIADRIDKAHNDECDRAYAHGYDEGCADAFETRNSAENLEADGWVRLPVDESDEVIRIGDRMDEWYGDGWHATAAPVDTMELSRKADGSPCWMVRLDSDSRTYISPKLLRHHHAPTVEDVLRELMAEVSGPCYAEDLLLAKYAEKLRLREDA